MQKLNLMPQQLTKRLQVKQTELLRRKNNQQQRMLRLVNQLQQSKRILDLKRRNLLEMRRQTQ